MRGIRKHYGPTAALRGVDLDLRVGEVHALVGENGAGKSTLMKVLAGAERHDAGTMLLDGVPYAPHGTADARRRGVAMVYQERTLAPHLSVEANVLLGIEPARWGMLLHREGRRRVAAALAALGHPELPPEAPVGRLGPGARQVVEIARALLLDLRLLVLDEPTSSLGHDDAERLFALVRRLRDRGITVVYISHFLEEVQRVADRFTVLRDGLAAGGGAVRDFPTARVVEMMVGRPLDEQIPRVPHTIEVPVLRVHDLAGRVLPRGASLTLHRGEILGLAGIVGAGRTELLRCLFGLDPVARGEVRLLHSGGTVTLGGGPTNRIARGLGLLSEDRQGEGLALAQGIADNLTCSRPGPYSRWGWLRLRQRRRAVGEWLDRLGVRRRGEDQPAGELSGGNQQKVALGRLLHQDADVLLLDEPTRGIDLASKAEVYRTVGELAARGKAVLFVSSHLPELLGVCDTLAVMTRGRLGPARPVALWTAERILAEATGGGNA
jgi:ribose transport system ATP-binding protein